MTSSHNLGLFISLEGIDGSGKSCQARLLYERLEKELSTGVLKNSTYKSLLITQEPSRTRLGKTLRGILNGKDRLDPQATLLLFLADRLDHLKTIIIPALTKGKIVVCDRFHDSTLAYQQYGQQLNLKLCENWINHHIKPLPKLTLWLDTPPDICQQRIQQRAISNKAPHRDLSQEKSSALLDNQSNNSLEGDNFEIDTELQKRTATGYHQLWKQSGERIKRVFAKDDPQVVHGKIWKLVLPEWEEWLIGWKNFTKNHTDKKTEPNPQ